MSTNRVDKYMRFVSKGTSPTGITKRWVLQNTRTGEIVGWVQWHGPWRRYCYFDKEASLYDSDCLRLIADFLEKAMVEHKEKLSTAPIVSHSY